MGQPRYIVVRSEPPTLHDAARSDQPIGDISSIARSVQVRALKELKLNYVGLDDEGFGHATDPKSGESFLLGPATKGFSRDWAEGLRFEADVTTTHYVTHARLI